MINTMSETTLPTLKSMPTVTIIMPVRNEANYIYKSLQAVLQQDYPVEQVEILVIDGMSTDETRAIVADMQQKCPNIFLLDNPGKIAPTALNIGLQKAQGEIIVRVDGHCVIQPDYVRQCVHFLTNENVDGVGGPMETIGETLTAQAIALAMSSPFGVGGSAFRTVKDRKMLVDTVAFPAYKKATIRKAGLFDEELIRNQDDEYNYRLREMGGTILMTPEIRSRYYSRGNLKSLWKQYFQYGFWKVRVMQKHPHQMSLRQFVPPLFVASILIFTVSSLFSKIARFFLGLILALYTLANLSASLITASKKGWGYFRYLPLIYAILHFSYGFGFLKGLARFSSRWKAGR